MCFEPASKAIITKCCHTKKENCAVFNLPVLACFTCSVLLPDMGMNTDTLISYGFPKSKMLLVSLLIWLHLQAVTQDSYKFYMYKYWMKRDVIYLDTNLNCPAFFVNKGWKLLIECC